MANQKKYWKGLEELNETPGFVKAKNKEFSEEIPIDEFLGKQGPNTSSTSRRDFLKYLGFSVAAATLAACEAPVVKTIPYVIKPEEVTPGIDNWYASTYFDGQDYCSILVKTRDGRPIKIEGNTKSPVTKGAANARVQASVLSLYDSERIRNPHKGKDKTTWEQVDGEIMAKLSDVASKGGNIRILMPTLISPSTEKIIGDFIEKFPTTKHVMWDAVSFSGMRKANEASFGKAMIPAYSFDKADVIVSIAADFLTNWLSPIEFSRQFAVNRKLGKDKKEMSRFIQFESVMTVSGANADTRVQIKPSEEGAVALGIYNAIAKQTGGATVSAPACDDKITEKINKTAEELLKSKGKSLVVAGSNDVSIQTVVNETNRLLGNYGATINADRECNLRMGNDAEFAELVNDMKTGKVDVLITYNVNPAYNAAAGLGFAEAYAKVPCRIALAEINDETASGANYICPTHHYLESWGDAEPYSGQYSLMQPAIYPLYSKKFPKENVESKYEGTRCAQENFLKWMGSETTDYYTYLQNFWKENFLKADGYEFTNLWNQTLQAGVYEAPLVIEHSQVEVVAQAVNLTDAASKIAAMPKGGVEVVLYEKTGIGNGNQANNPWLQEMPDPITKVTWDNYVTMNPAEMKDKGLSMLLDDNHEASQVTVSVGNTSLLLPVYPQPGQARGTIGIALGYGRTNAGKVADGIGKNAYSLVQWADNTFRYTVAGASVTKAEGTYKLAATQTHHTMIGRPVLKETTLEEYKKSPDAGNEEEKIPVANGDKVVEKSFKDVNLWDDFDSKEEVNVINNADNQGLRWKMAIDLNSCIGCGACVVSCNAENNVPVVGKEEIMNVREMHWIRIDRYYSSDLTMKVAHEEGMSESSRMYKMMEASADNPEVAFQPLMCQHCNHAPCETVCPVIATSHGSEGINQMVYNRCVGTKYCANNCPYKVRRFNWFNYYRDEKFVNVNPAQESNEMGRMVLNPDVVVRSRGVMEKCSFCLQRIQAGKLKAKIDGRPVKDGEITPACAQSCPTQALVFGNVNDSESRVANLITDERNYLLLADLDTQPNVFYMTKVRNSDKAKLSE
ncbi:MAG: TAT-variant-translocated molybdopterin oxidoreductase [Bacteroidia bacterium]